MKIIRVLCLSLAASIVLSGVFSVAAKAAVMCGENSAADSDGGYETVAAPTDGGIREIIPGKYIERYNRWKAEFLATDFGREQWNAYAADKNFVLIIKITNEKGQGAGTSDYQWDADGKLVGATIILGPKLDQGFPNPIYFPVMNSLSVSTSIGKSAENILAAAKIAHEIGHVNRAAQTGGEVFRSQTALITEYNAIYQKNNFNRNFPDLAELEKKLGGTPLDIWEDREYWGETNAMHYLLDRMEREKFFCPVVSKIENNLATFAVNYRDRFSSVLSSSQTCRD